MNFNEQPNSRKTYGPTRGRGSSSSYATGDNRPRGPNIRGSSTGNRPTSNERPTQDTHATGRCDSRNRSHANQGRSHPSDSDRRENWRGNLYQHDSGSLSPYIPSSFVSPHSRFSSAKRNQVFFPRWIITVVSSVFNNTLAHSPFCVMEKLRPKITELCLFVSGTKQTCLLSLNEFKFLIPKIATTVCPGCSFTFSSKKIGTLFSSVISLVIDFLTYFRSGF